MRLGIDDGILLSDLDAKGFDITNCPFLEAENVLDTTDPKLFDKRVPPVASVTNESVAKNAGIKQSKLALNGALPGVWLGNTADTAAPGDQVEHIANKNALNGYAGMSSGGKLPPGTVPVSGTGTLTSLKFLFPADISVIYERKTPAVVGLSDGDTVNFWPDASGNGNNAGASVASGPVDEYSAYWNAVPPECWFGINPVSAGAGILEPRFNRIAFAPSMIPPLPASKLTSGVLELDRIPPSKLLTAPGASDGHQSDYYARDGTYKPMTAVSYQPTLPELSITVLSYADADTANVNVTSSKAGVTLFGNTNATVADLFLEIFKQPIKVKVGYIFNVYSAKIGWNNSNIVSYEIPPNPSGGNGGQIEVPPPL